MKRTPKTTAAKKAGSHDVCDKPSQGPMMAELHHSAEAKLRKQQKQRRVEGREVVETETDAQRLLHELQVHQIELQMQNGELQEARDRMEELLEKYTDFYDFAPVGYFSLG